MRGTWVGGYVTVVAVWGGSYGITDVALTGFRPTEVAMWRTVTGVGFLTGLLVVKGTGLPRLGRAGAARIFVLGTLTTVAGVSATTAQTRVPSGLVAVLCAMTPLIAVVFYWLRRVPIPPMKWFSLSLGVAGVAVLLSPKVDLDHIGIALGLLAAGLFALAGILAADFFPDSSFTATQLTAAQLIVTAMLLVPFNIATADGLPPWPKPGPLAAVLALGVLAAGVGNVLFWRVLRAAGPVVAATTHQVVPVLAVAVGVVVFGQPLGVGEIAGAVMVLVAVMLPLPVVRVAGSETEDPHLEEALIGVHCEEACTCGNLQAVREEHARRLGVDRDAA